MMAEPRLYALIEEIRSQSEFEAAVLLDLDSNILAECRKPLNLARNARCPYTYRRASSGTYQ
jgi:hypothetical protein